jgi:pseudouridine kinase
MSDMTDIIVIGGANLDIKAKSLEVNHFGTSNPGRITSSPGGVGRNIAHNLARLGARVGLIAAIGTDHQGDVVLDATRAAGVDVSRIRASAPATGTYIAVLNPDGELVTAMNDMRAAEMVTPEIIQEYAEDIRAARLVVADCNQPLETLQAIADLARDKLFIEPVSVPKAAKLTALLKSGRVFMASPNLDQIESLTGSRDIFEGCKVLHALGLQHIVAHAGAEGAFVSNGEDIDHVPPQPAGPIIDVTGAGDAAVAGLVFALLQGDDLITAAAFGQTLAGRVIAGPHSTLE